MTVSILHMRPAIAMIELIFAIVVMGLTLMTAPLILEQAKKSSFVSMQQESIAAAASHISIILSRAWDQSDTNASLNAPILTVTNGDSNLEQNTTTGKREGTPINSNRTFLTPYGGLILAASSIGLDGDGLYNDIDDYADQTFILKSVSSANHQGDYIDTTLRIQTTVDYNIDSPTGSSTYATGNSISFDNPFTTKTATTNIKQVVVNLTNTIDELNKTITLKAFSCNIGTYKPLKRKEY